MIAVVEPNGDRLMSDQWLALSAQAVDWASTRPDRHQRRGGFGHLASLREAPRPRPGFACPAFLIPTHRPQGLCSLPSKTKRPAYAGLFLAERGSDGSKLSDLKRSLIPLCNCEMALDD